MNSYTILLWKRPGQNLFNCLLRYVQPYLIAMVVAFYFFIRIFRIFGFSQID